LRNWEQFQICSVFFYTPCIVPKSDGPDWTVSIKGKQLLPSRLRCGMFVYQSQSGNTLEMWMKQNWYHLLWIPRRILWLQVSKSSITISYFDFTRHRKFLLQLRWKYSDIWSWHYRLMFWLFSNFFCFLFSLNFFYHIFFVMLCQNNNYALKVNTVKCVGKSLNLLNFRLIYY
jgi:hypothetical protein